MTTLATRPAERPLDRLLDRLRREESRRVTVDEALILGRRAAYAAYRLRGFMLVRLVEPLLHVVDLLLLWAVLRDEVTLPALIRAGLALAAQSWHGALEPLRASVREAKETGAVEALERPIGELVAVSAVPALSFLLVAPWTLGLLLDGHALAAGACLAAAVWRFLGDLPIRAAHAGAFGWRRVYRTTGSILLPGLLTTTSLIVLLALGAPGLWAFFGASVVGGLSSQGLTARAVRHTYDSLPFKPWRPTWRSLRRRLSMRELGAILGPSAGAAAALGTAQLGALVLMAVALDASPGLAGFLFSIALSLTGPLVDSGASAVQLFTHDLARVASPGLRAARRRLWRLCLSAGLLAGLLGGLVGGLVGGGLVGVDGFWLPASLLVFGVARAVPAVGAQALFATGARLRQITLNLSLLGLMGLILGVLPTEALLPALAACWVASGLLALRWADREVDRRALWSLPRLLAHHRGCGPWHLVVASFDGDAQALSFAPVGRAVARALQRPVARWRRHLVVLGDAGTRDAMVRATAGAARISVARCERASELLHALETFGVLRRSSDSWAQLRVRAEDLAREVVLAELSSSGPSTGVRLRLGGMERGSLILMAEEALRGQLGRPRKRVTVLAATNPEGELDRVVVVPRAHLGRAAGFLQNDLVHASVRAALGLKD